MARADYHAIGQAIKDVIEADEGLRRNFPTLKVHVQKALTFGKSPQVVIYLMRREAPADEQNISAGTETRFLVRFSVWCFATDLGGLDEAEEKRDDLMGYVELALMDNRQLNGTVGVIWLDGGEFENPETGGTGFTSGGEIQVVARVTATI